MGAPTRPARADPPRRGALLSRTHKAGSPLPDPPAHRAGGGIPCKDLSELGGDHGGRHPIVGGQVVELAAIVAVTNPDGLTVGEAGGGRETHESVAVESIVSESEGVVNTIQQAVTGSGATVGGILSGGTLGVGVLVTDPLATKGVDRVKRTHTTSADGNVTSGNV